MIIELLKKSILYKKIFLNIYNPPSDFSSYKALNDQQSNDLIKRKIESGESFFAGKIGTVECQAFWCLHLRKKYFLPFPKSLNNQLWLNAGMFSISYNGKNYFYKKFYNSLQNLDYYLISFWKCQENVVNKFAKKA